MGGLQEQPQQRSRVESGFTHLAESQGAGDDVLRGPLASPARDPSVQSGRRAGEAEVGLAHRIWIC